MTKARIPTALCAIALCANAQAGNWVYGTGVESCGQWTAGRKDPLTELRHHSWLMGWISGASYYRNSEVPETDFHAAVEWMNNYCHDNPLEQISVGAKQLILQLDWKEAKHAPAHKSSNL